MKKLCKTLITLLLFSVFLPAQRIGEMAPEKEPIDLPPNSFGANILFSEGGFGLGAFYKYIANERVTFTGNLFFAETKDEREVEYYNYFLDQMITRNKKNRAMIIPLTFGIQYRMFNDVLTDNLRPYISADVGPVLVLVTPYIHDNRRIDFFSALKYAQTKWTIGGSIGFGAEFGLTTTTTAGIDVKYQFVPMLDEGLENIEGKFRKNLNSLYISLIIGTRF